MADGSLRRADGVRQGPIFRFSDRLLALLYEAVCGRTPFTADDPASILYMHVHEEPRNPRIHNPDIHPELEKLILRLMSKQADQRPSNARILKEQLQNLRRVLRGELTTMDTPALKVQGGVGLPQALPKAVPALEPAPDRGHFEALREWHLDVILARNEPAGERDHSLEIPASAALPLRYVWCRLLLPPRLRRLAGVIIANATRSLAHSGESL